MDTRQVVEGTKALDALGNSATVVEQKVRGSNGQIADTTKIMQAQAEQAKQAAQANAALGGSTAQLTLGQAQLIEKFREQAATVGMSRSQLMAYQAAQMGVTDQTRDAVAAVKAHEDALRAANKAKEDARNSTNMLTDALKLLAAGYAALKIGEYIKDSALMAARYETLGVVLETVGRTAGYTKTQMEAAADGIARQGITMLESRNSAIKLVQAHVDLANASKLARIAQDAAVIGNINSSEAFERLVNGISRGNVLILRNIGINVSLQNAYAQMADSLGKTTKELSDNERVQARLNAVIERGADIAGTYEAAMGTAGKQILSMQRYVDDLKTKFGETFNEVLTVSVMALTSGLKDANGEVSELAKNGQLAEWGRDLASIMVGVANAIDNILNGAKMAGTWAAHFKASGDIDTQFGRKYGDATTDQQRQKVRNEWSAALTEEQSQYEAAQVALAGQADRFQRSYDERVANRLAKQKADAAARLQVDQEYATNAQALSLINAGKSLEIQRKAQADLAKEVYGGTPHYRDTEGRENTKGHDDRAKKLQDALTLERTALESEKSVYDERDKMLATYHSKFGLSDDDFYAGRAAARAEYIAAEAISFAKESALVQGSIAKTPEEIAARKAKYDELVKAHQKFTDDMRNAGGEDVVAQMAARDGAIKQSDDAINKYLTSLDQEATKLEEANRGHEQSKGAVERETVAQLDLAIAYQNKFMAQQSANGATDEEIAQAPVILKYLEDQRAAHERIARALDTADADKAAKTAADKASREWDTTAKHIETTLADAIMNGGANAWKKLKTAIAQQVLQVPLQYIGNMGASIMVPGATQAGSSGGLIGMAQGASNLYSSFTGGMTAVGGLGSGFMGSLAGGLNGAGIGSGLTSSLGMSIGSGIADVVGPGVASALSSGLGAVASALPWVGAAVAAFAIGKAAFGHGDTEVKGTGIMGWLDGTGAGGQSYQQLHQDGGWLTSDRDWRKGTDFSAEMVAQLSQAFGAVKSSAKSAADALGVSSSAIDSFQTTFDIAYSGDAAKDQQAVTDFFAGISDQLATRLVPNLDQFSKTGETASATLQRLTGDFAATNQIAQLIGKNASDVFGSLGIASATARERLIDLAGGAAILGQQAAGYAQNFLTEAQRLAPVQAALEAAMAGLGLSSVTTRDQFKACVDSLDLTTEAGAKQFTAMMKLADSFALVHPAIDAAAEALKAQAKAEEEAKAAIVARIEATKAEASSLMSGVDGAFSVLQSIVAREKVLIQSRVDAETKAITKLTSLSQALHATLDGMNSPGAAVADRAGAQAQIRTALALAKAGGVLPDAEAIKKALSTVGQDASGQFSNYSDYLADLYRTKNDISDLAGITDDALTVEQKSLDALNEQLKSLDLVVSDAQKQIDIMKGQSTTLLSIDQAIQGLNTALLSAMANPVNAATKAVNSTYQSALGRAPDAAGLAYWQQQAASGVSVDAITSAIAGSPEATIQGMYKTMLGHSADAAGLQFWLQQVKNGTSLADIGSAIAGSSEAKLHSFDVGTNSLPSDMVAKVHKDERIIPAADNRELMRRLSSPSDNSAALLTEIKALRSEVSQLKKANSDENYSLNKKTLDMVSLLERVIFGGESINTTTV
jgi:hypothetical protein